MMLPDQSITQLIPQKPPFVLMSELLSVEGATARTRFYIDENHVLVENGILTEAGLVENMAQTAAVRAGYQAKLENRVVANGFITTIKKLEINTLPITGSELLTEITIEDEIFNTTIISAKVWCNKILIAGCEMNVLIASAGEESEA